MDGSPSLIASHRFARLAEQMQDKRFRDAYVASQNRRMLAHQMRKFRGDESQADFAKTLGKQATIVSRLENPSYSGWSLRTMFEVAQALGVAVFVRFMDFPTFLKYTDDMSEKTLRPDAYNPKAINELVRAEEQATAEGALKGLFSGQPQQQRGQSVWEGPVSLFQQGSQPSTSAGAIRSIRPAPTLPANDPAPNHDQVINQTAIKRLAEAAFELEKMAAE